MMLKTLSIFFMDDKGALSMMRLLSFILVVGGLTFAYVHPDHETGYIAVITLGLGGKVGQKFFEKKNISEPKPENLDSD